LAKLIKEKRQKEEEEPEEPVFKVPRLLPNRVVQSKTAMNIPTAVVPLLPTQPKPSSTFDLAYPKPTAKSTRDLILSQANSPSKPIKHFAPQPKPARRPTSDNFNRTISTVLAADYAFAEEPMFQKTSKVLSTSPLYEPQKIESLAKPPHERFLMNRSMPPQLDDLPRQAPTNRETSVSSENRTTLVLHELQPSRFESALQDLKK
jgi:hypothetical protein